MFFWPGVLQSGHWDIRKKNSHLKTEFGQKSTGERSLCSLFSLCRYLVKGVYDIHSELMFNTGGKHFVFVLFASQRVWFAASRHCLFQRFLVSVGFLTVCSSHDCWRMIVWSLSHVSQRCGLCNIICCVQIRICILQRTRPLWSLKASPSERPC